MTTTTAPETVEFMNETFELFTVSAAHDTAATAAENCTGCMTVHVVRRVAAGSNLIPQLSAPTIFLDSYSIDTATGRGRNLSGPGGVGCRPDELVSFVFGARLAFRADYDQDAAEFVSAQIAKATQS